MKNNNSVNNIHIYSLLQIIIEELHGKRTNGNNTARIQTQLKHYHLDFVSLTKQ